MDGTVKTLRDTIIEKMKMKYNLMRSSMEFIQTESEFMSEMSATNFGMMAFTVERIKTEVGIIEKYQQEVENLRVQLQTLEMLGNTEEEEEEEEEREGDKDVIY